MTMLGILACRIFEDELIHLLTKDRDIHKVILFDNKEPKKSFEEKLKKVNISYIYCESIDKIKCIAEKEKFTIFIKIIELKLHIYPKLLKEKIYEEIEEIKNKTTIKHLFLLYGLCGNVLGDIEKDFNTDTFNVQILKEENGDVVDDCIGAIVEGRKNYLELLKSFHSVGTFIFPPIGATIESDFMIADYMEKGMTREKAIEMVKMLYEMANYKNVLLMDTGLHYTEPDLVEEKLQEFSKEYNLQIQRRKIGSQHLFEKNYNQIKEKMNNIQ